MYTGNDLIKFQLKQEFSFYRSEHQGQDRCSSMSETFCAQCVGCADELLWIQPLTSRASASVNCIDYFECIFRYGMTCISYVSRDGTGHIFPLSITIKIFGLGRYQRCVVVQPTTSCVLLSITSRERTNHSMWNDLSKHGYKIKNSIDHCSNLSVKCYCVKWREAVFECIYVW